MANILPPPPVNDDPGSWTWLEWYRQLRAYVSTSGSVPWFIIDFAGSNITDIASRSHNNLQTLQGGAAGEMFHINATQYSAMSNTLEVLNTSATTALATTPTILAPPTTVYSQGITYDSSTGEITFVNGGSYSLALMLNATTAASNKFLYFYATIDTGSGHVIRRYTAREQEVTNSITQQYNFVSSNYFAKGTKLKLYLWGSTSGINLVSTDLPGTTAGTVTVPAIRMMWSGSL